MGSGHLLVSLKCQVDDGALFNGQKPTIYRKYIFLPMYVFHHFNLPLGKTKTEAGSVTTYLRWHLPFSEGKTDLLSSARILSQDNAIGDFSFTNISSLNFPPKNQQQSLFSNHLQYLINCYFVWVCVHAFQSSKLDLFLRQSPMAKCSFLLCKQNCWCRLRSQEVSPYNKGVCEQLKVSKGGGSWKIH